MSVVSENIEMLNKFPVKTLKVMANRGGVRLLIEDGRITGYMHGEKGKLKKENPRKDWKSRRGLKHEVCVFLCSILTRRKGEVNGK